MKRIIALMLTLFSLGSYAQEAGDTVKFRQNGIKYSWVGGIILHDPIWMPDFKKEGDTVVLVIVDGKIDTVSISDLQGSGKTYYPGEGVSFTGPDLDTINSTGDGGISRTELGDTAAAIRLDQILVYTPEQFGAVGDGVTDDTSPLQAWINQCISDSVNGYAAKKYLVSEMDITGANNLKIYGGGTFYKKYSTTNLQHAFNITNSVNVQIENLNFIGTSKIDTVFSLTTRLGGIKVFASSFISVSKCSFKKFISWGIFASDMNGGTFTEGMIIDDCLFTDFPLDPTTEFQAGVILSENAEYSTVRNCRFYRIPSAVRFDDAANSIFDNNIVMDLNGQYNTTTAALFQDFRSNSGKLQITNNKFNHIETGQRIIYVKNDPAKTGNGYIISENEMLIVGDATNCYPIYVENAPNSLITGNRIRPASTVSGSALITLFRCANSIVSENYLQGGFYSIQVSDNTINIGENIYNAPAAGAFNYVGTGAAFAINTTLGVTLGGSISDGSGIGSSTQVLYGGSNPTWGNITLANAGVSNADTTRWQNGWKDNVVSASYNNGTDLLTFTKRSGGTFNVLIPTDTTSGSGGGSGIKSIGADFGIVVTNDSVVGVDTDVITTKAYADSAMITGKIYQLTSNITMVDSLFGYEIINNTANDYDIVIPTGLTSTPFARKFTVSNLSTGSVFIDFSAVTASNFTGTITGDSVFTITTVTRKSLNNFFSYSGASAVNYYTKTELNDTLAFYTLKPTVIGFTTARNIAASDIGNTIACTTSDTLTITLTFSDMAVGETINYECHGTEFTVTGATGVSINGVSAGSAVKGDGAVYTGGIIRKTGTNTYIVL